MRFRHHNQIPTCVCGHGCVALALPAAGPVLLRHFCFLPEPYLLNGRGGISCTQFREDRLEEDAPLVLVLAARLRQNLPRLCQVTGVLFLEKRRQSTSRADRVEKLMHRRTRRAHSRTTVALFFGGTSSRERWRSLRAPATLLLFTSVRAAPSHT